MPVMDYRNGASAVEWVSTLDKILQLDFDIVNPGHGRYLNKERIRSDRQKLITMNSGWRNWRRGTCRSIKCSLS
jgi:glyoxylase-like metal-dependent hydrolase (beta-lactamase superfamily II)